jgi:DNA polymerase-3 subunit delta'
VRLSRFSTSPRDARPVGSSRDGSLTTFERFREQHEAKRLLEAALTEGPAHAYLFHGPAGVGKREMARAFARALLGTTRHRHPDMYELEALGDMIRIDAIRELRRDLHMRPFEAQRRVYLILSAELMNEEAADALLKDLEEPPSYAVLVLVADTLGPIAETIRSRCQLVPFTRFSERAMREVLEVRAPELDEQKRIAFARVSAGRLDRLARLLDPKAAGRRETLLGHARSVYLEVAFEPSEAASALLGSARQRGSEAKEVEEVKLQGLDLPAREAEQRIRRAQRGAEREELLAQLEELASWYRDLVVVALGAEGAAMHVDRIEELRADATRERLAGAERAVEAVLETWRRLEEFNLVPQLALEALFVELARELRSLGSSQLG